MRRGAPARAGAPHRLHRPVRRPCPPPGPLRADTGDRRALHTGTEQTGRAHPPAGPAPGPAADIQNTARAPAHIRLPAQGEASGPASAASPAKTTPQKQAVGRIFPARPRRGRLGSCWRRRGCRGRAGSRTSIGPRRCLGSGPARSGWAVRAEVAVLGRALVRFSGLRRTSGTLGGLRGRGWRRVTAVPGSKRRGVGSARYG